MQRCAPPLPLRTANTQGKQRASYIACVAQGVALDSSLSASSQLLYAAQVCSGAARAKHDQAEKRLPDRARSRSRYYIRAEVMQAGMVGSRWVNHIDA